MSVGRAAWGVGGLALVACIAVVWARPKAEVDPRLAALSGTYVQTSTSQTSDVLRIDAQGSFERRFHCCGSGEQYEGSATVRGDALLLQPSRTMEDHWRDLSGAGSGSHFEPSTYRVVNWGDRVYLVADGAVSDFCNAINQGWEPRDRQDGEFHLREGDWRHPSTGAPDLPPEWQSMILPRDLEATITEVVGDAGRIDIGLDDGLREGMILIARDVPTRPEIIALGAEPARDTQVRVGDLEAGRCLVRLRYPMPEAPPLEVGLRVTSRAVDR